MAESPTEGRGRSDDKGVSEEKGDGRGAELGHRLPERATGRVLSWSFRTSDLHSKFGRVNTRKMFLPSY